MLCIGLGLGLGPNLRVDEFALKFVDGAESEGECE